MHQENHFEDNIPLAGLQMVGQLCVNESILPRETGFGMLLTQPCETNWQPVAAAAFI